jgi:hypothetical protein
MRRCAVSGLLVTEKLLPERVARSADAHEVRGDIDTEIRV